MKRSKRRKKELAGAAAFRLVQLALTAFSALLAPTATSASHFYAQVPQLGALSGVRLRTTGGGGELAAFLGVPYAAPPTGLLRLMPAGAAQQASSGAEREWRLLEPGARRVQVRSHAHFGPECVRLADWLPAQHAASVAADEAKAAARREERRARQSEDCLNLNLFVPTRDSQQRAHKASPDDDQWEPAAASLEFNSLNSKRAKQQQIKSNYPSQSNRDPNENQADRQQWNSNAATQSGNQQANQAPRPPLKPLIPQRLPVLVLFHGELNAERANSLAHLNTARATNALVVTFNYRLGLLGFLPYVDQRQPGENALRHNHAIWDQVGLLHWLRDNVAAFGADPHNLTLMALDNQAAQLVQLLTMSPLAKGLFKRAVLVVREEESGEEVAARAPHSSFKALANNALNDLWRRLTRELSGALSEIFPLATNQSDPTQVYEFLQLRANLSQLAELEVALARRLEAGREWRLLELIRAPTLADKLLFPHLAGALTRAPRLLDFLAFAGSSSWARPALLNASQPAPNSLNQTGELEQVQLMRAELNYCAYLRQLHQSAGATDYLSLLPQSDLPARATPNAWHHSPASQAANSSRPSKLRRALIAANFNHLHQLHLLNQLIANSSADEAPQPAGYRSALLDEPAELEVGSVMRNDEEEEEEAAAAVWRRQQQEGSLARLQPSAAATLRRRSPALASWSPEARPNELGQLTSLMGSYDLLLGYLAKERNQEQFAAHSGDESSLSLAHFSNISNTLLGPTSVRSLNAQLLAWFKLADFHFIATRSANDKLTQQFCDYSAPAFVQQDSLLVRKNFAFIADEPEESNNSSWLSASAIQRARFLERDLANFIRFGDPNNGEESRNKSWFAYDSLSRKYRRMSSARAPPSKRAPTAVELQVQLDLVPYLSALAAPSKQTESSNSSAAGDSLRLLSACLSQVNLAANSSGDCLARSVSRFKRQLLQHAAQQLTPLARPSESANSRRRQSAPPADAATHNLLSSQAGDASQELGTHGEEPRATQSDFNQQLEPHKDTPSAGFESSGARLRGLLAGAYKGASGRALTLVVGAGLSIFMLNLVIVVFIALKTARRRRRGRAAAASQAASGDPNETDCRQTSCLSGAAKKSTLKRAAIDLNDALEASSGGRLPQPNSAAKQLKFDLSGLTEPSQQFDTTDGAFFVARQPDFDQQQQQQQQQVILMHEFASGQQQVEGELLIDASRVQQAAHAHHHHHHHQHAALQERQCKNGASLIQSPLTNQSRSSTTSSQCAQQSARHARGLKLKRAHLQSHLAHSPSVPGDESSATLSLTPIQLQAEAQHLAPGLFGHSEQAFLTAQLFQTTDCQSPIDLIYQGKFLPSSLNSLEFEEISPNSSSQPQLIGEDQKQHPIYLLSGATIQQQVQPTLGSFFSQKD